MLDWNVSFLRFETAINWIASFPKKTVVIIYMYHGLFQKKSKQGQREVEDMEFPGVLKSIWKFQGSWRKKVEFSPNQKEIVEFLWVLVFGLRISKGCSTILWNLQGWSFVFSRISKGKVTTLKIAGIFSKKYVNTTPVYILSGIAQCCSMGE